MKIDTLIDDIYRLLEGKGVTPSEEDIRAFGNKLADMLASRMLPRKDPPVLRISNLGTKCDRKLWYSINTPELGESLDGQTRLKFLYGDILEYLLLFLCNQAGHRVAGEQSELDLYGVKGHPDAFIDGRLIDVKSASSYGFQKFKSGALKLGELSADPFGYVEQINGYYHASRDHEELTDKDAVSFLVIDKVSGELCLDTHRPKNRDYETVVRDRRRVLEGPVPDRGYPDIPDGKSGNRKLGIECSYCSFKQQCWPGLRGFAYSGKPVYLTEVAREPNVPEFKIG